MIKTKQTTDIKQNRSSIRKLIFQILFIAILIFLNFIKPKFSFIQSVSAAENLTISLKYIINVSLWLASAAFINQLIIILLWERKENKKIPHLLKNVVVILIYIAAIAAIISFVFNKSLTGFWATSSVFALVLGFALRNIIMDMFTGLAVNIDQPYKLGDWIMVHQGNPDQNIIGEIQDINWRTTRIRTEINTMVLIPNSLLTTFVVTNYSHPTAPTRMEAIISLEPEIPINDAKRIILAGAKNVTEEKGFIVKREPEVLLGKLSESGYDYKIRYWLKPWTGIHPGNAHNLLLSSILNHLELAGIFPAFPKTIVYHAPFQVPKDYQKNRKDILQMIPLFNPLLDEELNTLAETIDLVEFNPGINIITEDEQGTSMFIITEGLVDVFLKKGDKEIKVARLAPGQFFGEISLCTGASRSATIKTVTKVKSLEIKKEHLSKILVNRPKIAEALSNIVTEHKLENELNLKHLSVGTGKKQKEDQNRLMKKIRLFFKLPLSI